MTLLADALMGFGAALVLLAAVGVIRLPDVFARMHAGTKAASLGLAFTLTGAVLLLPSVPTVVKVVLAIVFQFGTAPVAAHVIGRAAYRAGADLWETRVDELGRAIEEIEER